MSKRGSKKSSRSNQAHLAMSTWCWAHTQGWPSVQGRTRSLLGVYGPQAAHLARARAQLACLADARAQSTHQPRAIGTCRARWAPAARAGSMLCTLGEPAARAGCPQHPGSAPIVPRAGVVTKLHPFVQFSPPN